MRLLREHRDLAREASLSQSIHRGDARSASADDQEHTAVVGAPFRYLGLDEVLHVEGQLSHNVAALHAHRVHRDGGKPRSTHRLPGPQIEGRIVPRTDHMHLVLGRDALRERGAVVAARSSGRVELAVDLRKQDGALAATVRRWRHPDLLEVAVCDVRIAGDHDAPHLDALAPAIRRRSVAGFLALRRQLCRGQQGEDEPTNSAAAAAAAAAAAKTFALESLRGHTFLTDAGVPTFGCRQAKCGFPQAACMSTDVRTQPEASSQVVANHAYSGTPADINEALGG
mmetsp:Transcript_122360/g.391462  ORF Transcript_122360/g.391462 Transcript_122360/m.391462 type:complete len:284 (+) Transcript_122360:1388-2239(+)